jgi:hypothetical protein
MTAAQELRIALSALLAAAEAKETAPGLDIDAEIEAAHLALAASQPGARQYLRPDVRAHYFAGLHS